MPDSAPDLGTKPQRIIIRVSPTQFNRLSELLTPKPDKGWKEWLKPIAVPVLITALGALLAQKITEHYSKHQEVLAQAQAAEKYLPYFEPGHSHQQRYLALQSLIQIGNYDAAADVLAALPHDYQGAKSVLNPPKPGRSGEDTEPQPPAPTEDDKAFANALILYSRKLLPRLCYGAALEDQNHDTLTVNNLETVKLLLEGDDGLSQVESVAFPGADAPGLSWMQRIALRLDDLTGGVADPETRESLRLQRLGALVAISSKLDEIRQADIDRNFPDSSLQRTLERFSRLREPLEKLALGNEASPPDPESRAKALTALVGLDPTWLGPSPHLNLLQRTLLDEKSPFELREAAMNALTAPRNLTTDAVESLRRLVAGSWSDSGNKLVADLSRQRQVASALLVDAFRQRLAKNEEPDDSLIASWLNFSKDPGFLLDSFEQSPRHRQLAIVRVLYRAVRPPNSDRSINERVLDFARTKSKSTDAVIREGAYTVLFNGPHDVSEPALTEALSDSSPAVVQQALRHINRRQGCDLLDTAPAKIFAVERAGARFLLENLETAAQERCNPTH